LFLRIVHCVCVQIVKQLWQYIRKNNLQDPSNKRKIICDDALRVVFETDCTDMFKMNKLLAKHIIPLQPSSMYCDHYSEAYFCCSVVTLRMLNLFFCSCEYLHRGIWSCQASEGGC
jgi:hypothetical protein